jgi:hypothetical protein
VRQGPTLSAVRDPRRGWWTPEFRELLEAVLAGELRPDLELDAVRAADELRPLHVAEVGRVDGLALSVLLALDDRRYRQARSLTEALLDATDELRQALGAESAAPQARGPQAVPAIPR